MKKLILVLFLLIGLCVSAQTDVSGTIASNVTWEASKSPYNITNNITVSSGVTLTIEPGVTVKYTGNYRILVRGNIISNGSAAQPILFNGNTTLGTEKMIFFKGANLTNSSFKYCNFTGPQRAIQLAEETYQNQDSPKNSNRLVVENCNFLNTEVITAGYYTGAEVLFNNSNFKNVAFSFGSSGGDGYERMLFQNSLVENSVFKTQSWSWFSGFSIEKSTVSNTTIEMSGYLRESISIQDSKFYNSPFKLLNINQNSILIQKSLLVNSLIESRNTNLTIANSVFSFDGNSTPIGINTDKITMTNSILSGKGKGIGLSIEASGQTTISNSLITDNAVGIKIQGTSGNFDIQNNNFLRNKTYAVENLNKRTVEAFNNFWGTTDATEIENLIHHYNDDDTVGEVNHAPYKSAANTLSLMTPPLNVAKKQVGNDLVLSWTANSETDLTGYKLYSGSPTGLSYTTVINLGKVNTYTVVGGTMETEYALSAFNNNSTGTDDQINGFESWFTVAKDPKVSLSYNGGVLNEKSGKIKVFAQLSTALPYATTVDLSFTGTATKGVDYQTTTEKIIIPAGSASNFIEITLLEDQLVELTETIIIEIASVDNATIDGVQKITLSIENLNKPTASLTVSKNTIAENESSIIKASLDTAISTDVVISLNPSGTAIYNSDFNADFVSKGTATTVAGGNGQGGAMNQLNYPSDVSVASDGTLYVLDRNNGRIQKWGLGAIAGTTVTNISEVSRFSVDTNGNIYGLDSGNHRIQKWAVGGTTWTTIAGGNGQGSDSNQFNNPQGFYVDAVGNIFVADYGNHRIQKWLPGATAGITVAGGNGAGSNANQLNTPYDVSTASDGTIYVLDYSNSRIQKWKPGAINGTTVTYLNSWGANKIFVDRNGDIYVVDPGHRIQKWAVGGMALTIVAGGNGQGSQVNQLNSPTSVYVGPNGNVYVADYGNHRIQKYQYAPQIIIKAGEKQAQLTISGVTDTLYEDEEIITLETSATNANLSVTSPISIQLTDLNNPPTVSFAFSQTKIPENSTTDVTFTARLSTVSGKNTSIEFTLEGTATETTEYVVSSKTINIPAGQSSGYLTVSTKDLDDALVEVLESIVFKVKTITSATATVQTATLLLESDDNPTVSFVIDKTTIAEHESALITATLGAPASKDAVISFNSTGIAKYDVDYTIDFEGKGTATTVAGGNTPGSAMNQLNNPYDVSVSSDGTVYVLDSQNNRIQKWEPGAITGTTVTNLNGWTTRFFVDTSGNIYVLESGNHRIQKWTKEGASWTTVAGGNGEGSTNNKLSNPQGFYVDAVGNVFVADYGNHRIQKWSPGATVGIKVAGGNGAGGNANQFSYPYDVSVNSDGTIFVLDYNNGRIQKWMPNATTGTTAAYLNAGGISRFFVDDLSNIYTVDQNNYRIQKWASGGFEWTTVAGSNGEVDRPNSVFVDKTGNIYAVDSYNHRVQKYQNAPQIIIKAGNTTATITVKGIEDFINDEGDESIILKMTVQNVNLDAADELNLTLLDNKKTLTLNENPFMGLSNGAVAWGDFDLDGDQDVAIMGQSPTGAVTAIFENKNGSFVNMNQNFSKLYGGDISWVDLNKDGWIDLVVSGFSASLKIPETKVYMNIDGEYFDSTTDYGLPQLASTKMAWGDLDNDGDIDLAISGLDSKDNYIFSVYHRENNKDNFVKESQFMNSGYMNMNSGFINGDLKIVDVDLDGDNDIVFNGKTASGYPTGGIVYNSYVKSTTNYYASGISSLTNSTIEVNKFQNSPSNSLTILSSGVNANGDTEFYSNGGLGNTDLFPKLKDGDISVGDFDNDGLNDIVFTGEDKLGNPITKLFIQDKNGAFQESAIQLKGLRKSTAHWVDYDMDGDLDLFLTGIDSEGAKTLLYKSEILNKINTAPAQITGLIATDLGNGRMRFSWDIPKDDFSTSLGYVIRLGTTADGTELSNTESDITTGRRLITKPAAIYTNFFETQLDPGNYFWAVQAVDTGLQGGSFSNEEKFTLTYEWKILNQGGIVDRSINGVKGSVLKLVDIDNDNDLDLIYGSKSSGSQLLKYDGKRLVNESNAIQNFQQITNLEVGDINGDGFSDILVNHGSGASYKLSILLSTTNGHSQIEVGEGLYNAKSKIVDLNNDGKADIILAGMTNDLVTGRPKFLLYEYIKGSVPTSFKKTDISSQIEPLKNASFDLGDVDNDQDVDFIISGYNDQSGTQSFLYKNTTILGGSFKLEKTQNNFVGVDNGTTNLIDFDGDGDLDAIYTGTSPVGDVFEIYMNQNKQGKSTWPKLNNMGLTSMREGKIDMGDFNGDGYSDLLFSGVMQGQGNITKLSEYVKATNKYKPSAFDVSEIMNAEVEFGDLDGDGDLDFVIAGEKTDKSGYIFRTYINVRNDSAKVLAQASASTGKAITGKLMNTTSEQFIVNKPPSIPINDKIQFLSSTETQTGLIPVELSWLAATDDHTPSDGLSYSIKVGTTPGGEEIMSSNANTNGMRKTGEKGNAEHNLKWRLSLPIGTYYFSVQSVDASYAGSEFSTPLQFKVTALGIDSDSDGDGIENSLDLCPNTPKGDAVDSNGCSIDALLGDSNGDLKVNVLDLVLNVDYILGNNPIPFVFKAADVNRDSKIDVLDIVGTVDIILTSTTGKNTVTGKKVSYYPNTTSSDAVFYWEGKDLYVSSNESIAGLQLVFNKDFEYKVADELLSFDWLNFKNGEDQTVMMYSFTAKSIKPGRTKLLTKLDNNEVIFNVEKAAVGTPKGLKLAAKYKLNAPDTQTAFFIVSPNPSNGLMNLNQNLSEQRDKLLLKVFNLNGVLVWSREELKNSVGQQMSTINLDFLSEGIYVIVIETFKDGEIKERDVKRVIIRK
jgi:sugar lactone lactonase YvrE